MTSAGRKGDEFLTPHASLITVSRTRCDRARRVPARLTPTTTNAMPAPTKDSFVEEYVGSGILSYLAFTEDGQCVTEANALAQANCSSGMPSSEEKMVLPGVMI